MESQTKRDNAMTEQEEFEFRLRLEQEAGQEEMPLFMRGMTAMFDQPPPPTMGEYVTESIGRSLSSIPALMAESSALYGLSEGEFPSQLPPQGTAGQAYTQFQRSLGLKPEMRPATQLQRAAGTVAGAVTDPLNLFSGAGLARQGLSNMARGLGLFEKGVGVQTGIAGVSALGGEYGGEAGGQYFGVPGQVIGSVIGSLASGGGTIKAGQMLSDRLSLKDIDVEDLANVEGVSRAKDIIEKAIKTDPQLQTRLENVQKKIEFVTGAKGSAAIAGLDNLVLNSTLKKLATDDVEFATELNNLYADLKSAVRKKATELYPKPSAEIPSGAVKITEKQVDLDQRIKFIDDQLNKLTIQANIAGGTKPAEIGTAIQNLVVAKEKAAKNALRPEYDSVLGQASKQGALLPAQDTQDLLNTAEQLFQGDPWAKQAPLLKLVREQSSKFKAMRRQPMAGEAGALATTAPDLTMGMDITSLDSLKRRVAQDIRETRDPNRQDKLRLLQTRVDEALDKVQNSSGDILIDFRGEKLPFGQAMSALDTDYFNKVGIPFKDAASIEKITSADYAEKISPLIASSPTAMRQFLNVAGEEGVSLAEKSVMSKLYNQALNKDGFIDPVKLDNLLSKTSTNGGYSDIVDQLPALKQRLSNTALKSQYLASEKVAIDDAAKDAMTRAGQSFLKDYDVRGVDGIVSKMTDSAGKGYLNRFFVDLKKLSPSDQKNSLLAVKNGLVTQMLDSPSPLDYLNKNSSAFIKVFGINEYNNLNALADVSRLSKTLDISKLNFSKAATEQESALQRAMGGVAPQRITGILVNQIASVFNKGFRILSLIGQQNIDQATKDAQRKLFLDENGVKAIVDSSTKFFTKKGEEIQLKTMVTPDDVNKFATAVGLGALRQNYFGVSATASPSEVVRPQEAVVEEE
jgi:hypothetical protein